MRETSQCRLIRDPGELFLLRPQWEALWELDPFATPFQSPQWLLPWRHQFSEGRLCSVAIFRSERLAGLIPLYLYPDPCSGLRKLLPLGISTSDYLDGVFAAECSTNEIVAALESLLAEEFDTLELPQLREGSKLAAALEQWRPAAFHPEAGESTTRRDAVPFADLHAKIRRNTRYYSARAATIGNLTYEEVPPSGTLQAYEELERLHTARWQQAGQSGVLADLRVRQCHREAVVELAEAGLARIYRLRLDGETIAALYTLRDSPACSRRTVYCYLSAYSPAHADLCPGTLLLAHVIDRIAQQGFSLIDFLRGDEKYKDLWHPVRVPTHRFRLEQNVAAPERNTESRDLYRIPVTA